MMVVLTRETKNRPVVIQSHKQTIDPHFHLYCKKIPKWDVNNIVGNEIQLGGKGLDRYKVKEVI